MNQVPDMGSCLKPQQQRIACNPLKLLQILRCQYFTSEDISPKNYL
jgi:hypothetical protein